MKCIVWHDLQSVVGVQHTEGVYTAREFVWWYNGHPEYCNLPIDLTKVNFANQRLLVLIV